MDRFIRFFVSGIKYKKHINIFNILFNSMLFHSFNGKTEQIIKEKLYQTNRKDNTIFNIRIIIKEN